MAAPLGPCCGGGKVAGGATSPRAPLGGAVPGVADLLEVGASLSLAPLAFGAVVGLLPCGLQSLADSTVGMRLNGPFASVAGTRGHPLPGGWRVVAARPVDCSAVAARGKPPEGTASGSAAAAREKLCPASNLPEGAVQAGVLCQERLRF